MSTILGVHGISQQYLGRHQLIDLWSPALRDGLERATGRRAGLPDLDMVFYGDLFLPSGADTFPPGADTFPPGADTFPPGADTFPPGADTFPPGADIGQSKGAGARAEPFDDVDDDEAEDLVAAASEVVGEDELATAAREPVKGRTRMPLALQAAVAAVERRFGAAAAVLFFGDLRQVRRYLREPAVRQQVDERVAEALTGGCRAVVAHSLGSVVAFDHLHRRPGPDVPALVTIGSPLGLRMVRRWLPEPVPQPTGQPQPTGEPLRAPPPRVGRWTNVYDRRDPVACAAPLSRWWRDVHDVVVDNGGDAHDATRYLSRRATGAPIAAVLPDQP